MNSSISKSRCQWGEGDLKTAGMHLLTPTIPAQSEKSSVMFYLGPGQQESRRAETQMKGDPSPSRRDNSQIAHCTRLFLGYPLLLIFSSQVPFLCNILDTWGDGYWMAWNERRNP